MQKDLAGYQLGVGYSHFFTLEIDSEVLIIKKENAKKMCYFLNLVNVQGK